MTELTTELKNLKTKLGTAAFSSLFLNACRMHREAGRKDLSDKCLDVVIVSELEDMQARAREVKERNFLDLPEKRILSELESDLQKHRECIKLIEGLRK